MSDLERQREELRIALHDLGFAILDALGIVRLAERFGTLKPWATEARTRKAWRKP